MIITCEACGTSFKIKTSLIKETGSTVRCSKCQQVFIAYPQSSANDQAADFSADESLEAKIDNVLGEGFDDEFSDLESEISLETAEVATATSEELFDTSDSVMDESEKGFEEPEIMMSALEQDDEDIISLDALVSGSTVEEDLELGEWLDDEEDESDVLSFGDLGAKATVQDDSEIMSFDDIGAGGEELSLDDLESTSEQDESDEDVIELDDMESGAPADEKIGFEETAEEEIDFLDFEDEEVQPKDDFERALDEMVEDEDAEPEEIVFEAEGGVDTNLDDFELEKKSEDEDTSEGTGKDAGKIDADAKKPAEELSKIGSEEEDFELDLDLELEGVPEEAAAEEEGFELDFDLESDAKALVEASGELEDFGKADELGLDLDMDLEGFEDLDLTEEPSAEAFVEEDLGLDLDLEAGAASEDLGLDLDMDEFADLDLDLGEELTEVASGTIADEDFDLDLDLGDKAKKSLPDMSDDDFDLDFDLEPEEAAKVSEPEVADDDFDLDFDLDAGVEEKADVEEESFDLDLNIEPEAESESDDFDLDLDFGEGLGDESSVVAESFVDEDDGAVTKTEEFDLTQIEDVLDFDEMPEPEEVRAGEDLDDLGMEAGEAGPFTVSEEDEMSIDLETMLDEEEAAEGKKEVSLETVEERDKKIEKEYKKTVVEEQEEVEEAIEEIPDELERKYQEQVMASSPALPGEKQRNLKKILIFLVLLIALGAIIYAGIQMFGTREEAPVAPVVIDQGNLQIEMIANPEYKFVENAVSGEILVVTGSVTNRYDHPRSNIQVKGTLYDSAGTVIVSSLAYGGNMLTDSELTGLELKTIEERLNNRRGDNNINAGIEPGENIPFTVVFSDLPQDVSELTVEVVQSAR